MNCFFFIPASFTNVAFYQKYLHPKWTRIRGQTTIIDVIFCIDVLSDITDTDSTLREMYRVLKLDGMLSVFEPHAGFEPGAWKPDRSIRELTVTGQSSLHERNDRILKFKKVVRQNG